MHSPRVNRGEPLTFKFLSISDFHGALDLASSVASVFKQLRNTTPLTFTVTAGDSFGASPTIPTLFGEEPAVKALRLMGIDADTIGNHSFDRNITHLTKMIALGAANDVEGKPVSFVCSNIRSADGTTPPSELPGLHHTRIFQVGPLRIGVVGIISQSAPKSVAPGKFGTLVIDEPAGAAMRAQRKLLAEGADLVICLVHMGLGLLDPSGPKGHLIDFAHNGNRTLSRCCLHLGVAHFFILNSFWFRYHFW